MNRYTGKTEEEAVELALEDLGLSSKEELNYQVISIKNSLFNKQVTIGVYSVNDVIVFADDYVKRCLRCLGLEGSTEAKYEDGIIKLNILCNKNRAIIGKNGNTLRCINELTRSACHIRFNGHYRILLNCDGYKENKYDKCAYLAQRAAKEVMETKTMVELSPMTSDERRIVHQVLTKYKNIKTESIGIGKDRHITVQYVESDVDNNLDKENKED